MLVFFIIGFSVVLGFAWVVLSGHLVAGLVRFDWFIGLLMIDGVWWFLCVLCFSFPLIVFLYVLLLCALIWLAWIGDLV